MAESAAMDILDSPEASLSEAATAIVEEEKNAQPPATGENCSASPEKIAKMDVDTEMKDLTIDIPKSSKALEKDPEALEEAKDLEADSSFELLSSPTPAEALAPRTESANSVELLESPLKSPSSNDVNEEELLPLEEDEEQKPGATKKSELKESETDSKESKESDALADSSIELISSPTSDDSLAKEKEVVPPETASKPDDSIKMDDDTAMAEDVPVASPKAAQEAKDNQKSSEATTQLESPVDSKVNGVPVEPKVKPKDNVDSMEIDESPSDAPKEALAVVLEIGNPPKKDEEEEPKGDFAWDGVISYNKDCINCNCKRRHKQYVLACVAILNFYKAPRKLHKTQYICMGCYDTAVDTYEEYAGLLLAKQPLLLREFKQEQADFVTLDSSDEEEDEKPPEKPEFSKNVLNLIENELEDAIKKTLNMVDFEKQLNWSKSIIEARMERLGQEFEEVDLKLAKVQSLADKMHCSVYNSCQVVHKQLPPLDLHQNICTSDYKRLQHLPAAGEIERPPIEVGETYYAVKNKAIASWVSVNVVEICDTTTAGGVTVKAYKIKYQHMPYPMMKTVTAKHLAYFDPPTVRLAIGTRVIAFFDGTLVRGKEKGVVQSAFYPGIIAEPLKQNNRFRYLIFYDDGYTQYVHHSDVRLVCQASEKVWEDVHPASRDFIQKYVEKYAVDRPMVQCTKGQSMNTESNGTWLYARVIEVDCSLVLMQFEADKNHTEWIYRGSLRLAPVFKETQNSLNADSAIHQMRVPRRTEPFIRYTKEMESSNRQVDQKIRAIARKSTAKSGSTSSSSASPSAAMASASAVRHLNNSTIYVDDDIRPKGQVVHFTAKRNLPTKDFKTHKCNPGCLFTVVHRLDSYSPLSKPLLSGWERMIMRQKTKRTVIYRGPCGRTMRNMAEVHHYLRVTNNILNVDNFDFTPDLCCLAEYYIESTIVKEADISKGQEKMAIPLVNYYDNTLPPPCEYAKQRIPTEGVNLNLDEEFLVCCDCEDDCSDKSKCACWQLTVTGVRYCNPKKPLEEIGYQYKRLYEGVLTGIYECNSRCKCKKNCLNRVVQHSLEMKLQVFKTSNRGWGLRCVNDIPKGAFVCIYAGHLLTEAKANEGGQDAGDEYFADLDYIEVAEQLKEGYESDVERSDPDPEDDSYGPDAEDDDDFRPNNYYIKKKDRLRSSRSNSSSTQNTELDSQERQVISFNPNTDLDETVRENSVRRFFGKDQTPFIMDAKTTGNLGRYFNHSCNPNLFVQNVFVDTHDLRFPWVGFFASSHIRSGTELTWNYNYEVGVVPNKVLYCQCGAANCRVRLL
ncbi:histone-lysine N-methyltransferase eggless [Drosophila subobscura]|uniref:histone-lysine N-methyltransferase eggless n=1 Tax=Drosophila subobscura TaxID=7241 RepID=UPI00155B0C1F|nr:histone-lysine N-methyltransferase eggless [Drosophila subobscura]